MIVMLHNQDNQDYAHTFLLFFLAQEHHVHALEVVLCLLQLTSKYD